MKRMLQNTGKGETGLPQKGQYQENRKGKISADAVSCWCPRRDLNPHVSRHMDLNHARLPIPPRGQYPERMALPKMSADLYYASAEVGYFIRIRGKVNCLAFQGEKRQYGAWDVSRLCSCCGLCCRGGRFFQFRVKTDSFEPISLSYSREGSYS